MFQPYISIENGWKLTTFWAGAEQVYAHGV